MINKLLCTVLPAAMIGCTPMPDVSEFDGIWLSDGYGTLAVLSGGTLATYAVAGSTCVSEGAQSMRDLLRDFTLERSLDGQTFLLRMDNVPHPMQFKRLGGLPLACVEGAPDTPMGNFDVFTATFAAHYAFFDLYGVDWDHRVAIARTQVSPQTSDVELFNILSRLVAPLRDGHVSISARIDGTRYQFDPNPGEPYGRIAAAARASGGDVDEAIDAFQTAYWIDGIKTGILSDEGTMAGQSFVQYGLAHPRVGYIALATVAGFARGKEDFPTEDLDEINAILDAAMTQFARAGVEAVILDLSVNFGGYDHVAMAIANRFATQPRPAFSKFAADATHPIVTDEFVTPVDRPSFAGPVYVMTSDVTVSAGEILTLAMRAHPQTIHVGEPTRGAFSNVLEKELPNGWEFGLSNEVYTDFRGQRWEGRGITPDIAIDIFGGPTPTQSHRRAVDAVIARAIGGD